MQSLPEQLMAGERAALAKAITLVESTRADHIAEARTLLDEVLPATGGARRIGISGTPGVGKSTFIEAFGLHLVEHGHRVAVLAVDPSSAATGGSILGDKTRMSELNKAKAAFIRPSPSGGTLGGVTVRSRDAVLLCEAAGYDIVIVETVGVGQSETAVAQITDVFLLLISPGGGDDLQGIKRGVMELADIIAVNKADGDLLAEAERTADSYRAALHLVRPKWDRATEVHTCSALDHTRVEATAQLVMSFWEDLEQSGQLEHLRGTQAEQAVDQSVTNLMLTALRDHPAFEQERSSLVSEVRANRVSSRTAAAHLLELFPVNWSTPK